MIDRDATINCELLQEPVVWATPDVSRDDYDLDRARRLLASLAWWTETGMVSLKTHEGTLKIPLRNRFKNVRPSGAFSGAPSVLWNADEIFVPKAAN